MPALASGITAANAIHRRSRAMRTLAELSGGAFRFIHSDTIHPVLKALQFPTDRAGSFGVGDRRGRG